MVEVRPLDFSRRDRRRFLQVTFDLNRRRPNWVPPLRFDLMNQTDPDRNPFFEHAEVQHWVAVRDGRDVGRIAGVVNERHNEFHEERTAHFGFFDARDAEVTTALVEKASAWAAEAGMDRLLGPLSYSTNDICGLLVDGFDVPPAILMPYNPPEYAEWLEAAGFVKSKDLLAYHVYQSDAGRDRLAKVAIRLGERAGMVLRCLDMKRFDAEVALVRDLYNRSWERNWGFVPMTDAELEHMAKDLKPVVDPRCILFAEIDGKVAGFALALPDYHQILIKNRSGRLFPFGLIRLLLGKSSIDKLRLLTLGVLPEYRRRGIEAALIHGTVTKWVEAGYDSCECSWILEDNELMLSGMKLLNGELTKRYRLYDRPCRQ